MASDPEWQQEQAGGHKEIGHKSLLESDALYQVYIFTYLMSLTNIFHCILFFLLFDLFLFALIDSTYLKPVCTQESLNPWNRSASWQQNTLGKVAAYHILCTYVLGL